ncbi:hypothetical protein KXV32_005201 [Aspergillus fumigatus]|nr:hypothetical protein KXV32_005201 [Aspergillus fumigatus]
MSRIKFAILDDYQNLSRKHFAHLTSRVDISYFPDTLDPPIRRHSCYARTDSLQRSHNRRPPQPETSPNNLLTTGNRNLSLDLPALTARGIPVAGTVGRPPGVNSTVQHTWALILALARHVARDDAAVKAGKWQGSLGVNLSGKTLALLGLGKLGAQVGRIAVLAFGMRVIAWSANLTQEKADEQATAQGLPAGSFEAVPEKREFLQRADVLSVHYVLSERSRGILGAEDLAALRPDAMIVNTSRGPLIDERALLETLNAGRIRGAALDVFDPEPLPVDSPWRTTAWGVDGRSEVLLTPHMGYGEEELINGWYKEAAENLERWLDGKELHVRLN